MEGWRRFWVRAFGAKIAPTAKIKSSTRIVHPWLLTLGDYSVLAEDVDVYNLGPIEIGDHTVVSHRAVLCAGTHDYTQPNLPLQRPTIRIGHGVWVCTQAFIGPGVTVGDNCVIGACAVVMRDAPAGMVLAGNPAKVVKPRLVQDANA
jgi:putative colanic acid biosynthesis acetyltransferase WcaF